MKSLLVFSLALIACLFQSTTSCPFGFARCAIANAQCEKTGPIAYGADGYKWMYFDFVTSPSCTLNTFGHDPAPGVVKECCYSQLFEIIRSLQKSVNTINNFESIEQQILQASDKNTGDYFGYSVAVSGDVIVVGAYSEDGGSANLNEAGAVYVFRYDGFSNWDEQQILYASDKQTEDWFGRSVAVSGDVIVVGANREDGGSANLNRAGAAYVFRYDGSSTWNEQQILYASDKQTGDYFGSSVAVLGDVIVVGAKNEDGGNANVNNAGAVYVFRYDGSSNWNEQQILYASDKQTGDRFGFSVAVSDDVIVVGAYKEDGGSANVNSAGAAYVFKYDGFSNWNEQQILHASDKQTDDLFGSSVAISGDVIVVGARNEDGGSANLQSAGAVYVFKYDGSSTWNEQQILHASDKQTGDYFGFSVAVSGDVIVVGARNEDGGSANLNSAGAVYVFKYDGVSEWDKKSILYASDKDTDDLFGCKVDVSNDVIVVGAYKEDGGSANVGDAGAAYVFEQKSCVATSSST